MTASSKRDLREVFSRRYRRARCSRAKGLLLDEFCAPAMNFFNRRSQSSRKNVLGHGCYGATIGRKPRSIASSPRRRSIEQSRLRSAPSARSSIPLSSRRELTRKSTVYLLWSASNRRRRSLPTGSLPVPPNHIPRTSLSRPRVRLLHGLTRAGSDVNAIMTLIERSLRRHSLDRRQSREDAVPLGAAIPERYVDTDEYFLDRLRLGGGTERRQVARHDTTRSTAGSSCRHSRR